MNASLPQSPGPELVFGLLAPIGVDLDLVADVLVRSLDEVKYSSASFRLTTLMQAAKVGLPLAASDYVASYRERIAYANEVRRKHGKQAMASLAVSAIRSFRVQARQSGQPHSGERRLGDEDERDEEAPLERQAYILRQLKRPDEVTLLRRVYGRQFIAISAYSPTAARRRRISERELASTGGLISDSDLNKRVFDLIEQDAREASDSHGQNLRDAFALADVFVDASSREKCESSVRRFIKLLFGNNQLTPTHDEYGMYIAKSASLRSSDLSRQVGAAIFTPTGEVISLGSNEVPKAGGGTYWAEDRSDARDFVGGFDPNERQKMKVLTDLLERMRKAGKLSGDLLQKETGVDVAHALLSEGGEGSVKESKLMDLIEFGRIIHAEMSALMDAARNGISTRHGTLYCTTFPCHLCAKHIVAAGVDRVVYLEPYPKSYAADLHYDSISVDGEDCEGVVSFDTFVGVSPYRYRDLFEKGKRKYGAGLAQEWANDEPRPIIEVYYPSYAKAENFVVAELSKTLNS